MPDVAPAGQLRVQGPNADAYRPQRYTGGDHGAAELFRQLACRPNRPGIAQQLVHQGTRIVRLGGVKAKWLIEAVIEKGDMPGDIGHLIEWRLVAEGTIFDAAAG